MKIQQGDYTISDEKDLMDIKIIHQYLSEESYWCAGIPIDVVKKSIEGAHCFGIFLNENQIGFARVITDHATFAYLADVFVLPEHRGKGLSKWLMKTIVDNPELQGLRRWILATRDAHALYEQFGFTPLAKPDRFMELHNPNVYQKNA
ncbi:N-acetyltransferase [Bacteroidota bacterium]|nr:N-acetyltransferase [Bacteroidota bacterium]